VFSLPILAVHLGFVACTTPKAQPTETGLTETRVSHQGQDWVVVRIDLRKNELLLEGIGEQPNSLNDLGPHRVAMNAGMYMSDLSPVGLYISQGVEHAPLELGPGGGGNFFLKPNGVFSIAQDGAAVTESTAWAASPRPGTVMATQSGPLLVQAGVIHPELNAASTSTYTRNGICAPDPNTALLFISLRPVSLWRAASFARDGLGCQDALYLDGGVSMLSTESGVLGKRGGAWGGLLIVR
jgi:uncharacterized protein YigE (DUF2233 family)